MTLGRSRKNTVGVGAQRALGKAPGGMKIESKQGGAKGRPTMLAVLHQFRVLVRSIRSHYDQLEKLSGMSGAQLLALSRVAEQPGIKVGELARALSIHQSTASNMLERLVGSGLVIKRRLGDDQRVVTVFITSRGKSALKSAPQPLIGALQQALSELPPSALQGLHAHLQAVIQGMCEMDAADEARSTPLSDM